MSQTIQWGDIPFSFGKALEKQADIQAQKTIIYQLTLSRELGNP